MTYNEKTRLSQILDDYPWLAEELPRREEQFAPLGTLAGRLLARRLSLADLSKMSGMSVDALLQELEQILREHGED